MKNNKLLPVFLLDDLENRLQEISKQKNLSEDFIDAITEMWAYENADVISSDMVEETKKDGNYEIVKDKELISNYVNNDLELVAERLSL